MVESNRPMSAYAQVAQEYLKRNIEKGGWVGRHAIASAFVYAMLDLADALRTRGAG